MIYLRTPNQRHAIPRDAVVVDTTSRARGWSQVLSPFLLGPVKLYGPNSAFNFENAWQYSKVYKEYTTPTGSPSLAYWRWAVAGWHNPRAVRYPLGKGATPLYSYWAGKRPGYLEARKCIYCPLYNRAVEPTAAFAKLCRLYLENDLWLIDFDAYDHHSLGMSYRDVLNCPTRKMGHAFVLAMMLDDEPVWLQPGKLIPVV